MIEELIFSNLIADEQYVRNVLPYLKEDYFTEKRHRILFKLIGDFFQKYNALPSKSALKVELDNMTIQQSDYDACIDTVNTLEVVESDIEWLMEQTEKFCQDKAIYNPIMESIQIIDGKSQKDKGSLPQLLQDALGVSFDNNIGHDFLEDYDDRYDFYHKKIERLEFDLKFFNTITRGGIPKTLNVMAWHWCW